MTRLMRFGPSHLLRLVFQARVRGRRRRERRRSGARLGDDNLAGGRAEITGTESNSRLEPAQHPLADSVLGHVPVFVDEHAGDPPQVLSFPAQHAPTAEAQAANEQPKHLLVLPGDSQRLSPASASVSLSND